MRYAAVVIGVSAGGIEALKTILPALPASFPLPIAIVQHRNQRSDGFLARYPTREAVDGLPPGEGAFLLCTYWLADNLALQGRQDEACAIFERLVNLRNDSTSPRE